MSHLRFCNSCASCAGEHGRPICAAEVQELIDTKRRVAAVWRRNGGPQIVQAALDVLSHSGRTFPSVIDGKPLPERIARIQAAIARYASPALDAALRRFAPRLAEISGLTYAETLARLQETNAG